MTKTSIRLPDIIGDNPMTCYDLAVDGVYVLDEVMKWVNAQYPDRTVYRHTITTVIVNKRLGPWQPPETMTYRVPQYIWDTQVTLHIYSC